MSSLTFVNIQNEIASRLRMDVNKADQLTLIKRWINQSQQDIWSAYDWSWAFDREIVQTVVDKTSGTVSINASSTAVTGSGTAFDSSDVGKYIQFSTSNDWYKVTAFASAVSLTIEKPYVTSTNLSGGGYTLRKIFYSVSSNVEKVLDIRQTITPSQLRVVSFSKFDSLVPNPTSTGNPVTTVFYGYDSSKNWQFTVYPFPTSVMNLEIREKLKATDLSLDSDISLIPEKYNNVIVDGALYRGLEYVRTDFNDRRAEAKRAQFKEGISDMISDADPESSYYQPVLENRETVVGPGRILRLPSKFGL